MHAASVWKILASFETKYFFLAQLFCLMYSALSFSEIWKYPHWPLQASFLETHDYWIESLTENGDLVFTVFKHCIYMQKCCAFIKSTDLISWKPEPDCWISINAVHEDSKTIRSSFTVTVAVTMSFSCKQRYLIGVRAE